MAVRLLMFDQRMYAPTGIVHKWVGKVTIRFVAEAINAAPMRSGELKAGISGDVDQTGPRDVAGFIASEAEHTMYVLEGTSSPIMSTKAWASGGIYAEAFEIGWVTSRSGKKKLGRRGRPGFWLALGKRPWPPLKPTHSVSGQRANNFLFTAWRRTAADHTAIRGKLPESIGGHF